MRRLRAIRPPASRLALLLGFVAVGIVGCNDDDDCSCLFADGRAFAWTANILDPSGAKVLDAKLYERVADGLESPAACRTPAQGGGCEVFSSRLGVPGSYSLRATRADGSSSTSVTVVVPSRTTCCGIEPVPQELTVALSP
jgi:hypothetical protein